jgi:DNA-binding CsgD family transcriptional regulator
MNNEAVPAAGFPAEAAGRPQATDRETHTVSAVLWALGLAREHGGAAAALAASGIEMPDVGRFEGVSGDLKGLLGRYADQEPVREAVALGLLAGRVVHQPPRARRLQDPTSCVMDRELVVQAAQGRSILRLPWVEEGLFVGRQLSGIYEMPSPVRRLAVEQLSAALAGERRRFKFTSYGHTYSVDAVPVRRNGDGPVEAVIAIAVPMRSFASAAAACERTAERLERYATLAEACAERYRLSGNGDAEAVERQRVSTARRAAERARVNAERLRSREAAALAPPPSLTSRHVEVLDLASHGLSSAEIAEQLGLSMTTVKTHFDNIYTRMGVSDRSAAVAGALRHGLIE